MSEDVKPCPFCGGKAKVRVMRVCEDAENAYVECTDCRARTEGIESAFANRPAAVAEWNRRVATARLAFAAPSDVIEDIRHQVEFNERTGGGYKGEDVVKIGTSCGRRLIDAFAAAPSEPAPAAPPVWNGIALTPPNVAHDLFEAARDADRLAFRYEGGTAQILRERAERLRLIATEVYGGVEHPGTQTMAAPAGEAGDDVAQHLEGTVRGSRPAPQVVSNQASPGPSDLAATPHTAPSPDPELAAATCEYGYPNAQPWCGKPGAAVRGEDVLCLYHTGLFDGRSSSRWVPSQGCWSERCIQRHDGPHVTPPLTSGASPMSSPTNERVVYWCRSCPMEFTSAASSNAHHDQTGHFSSSRCQTCSENLSHHTDAEYAQCRAESSPVSPPRSAGREAEASAAGHPARIPADAELLAQMEHAASSLRECVVESYDGDSNGAVAGWFRPFFLRDVADILDQARALLASAGAVEGEGGATAEDLLDRLDWRSATHGDKPQSGEIIVHSRDLLDLLEQLRRASRPTATSEAIENANSRGASPDVTDAEVEDALRVWWRGPRETWSAYSYRQMCESNPFAEKDMRRVLESFLSARRPEAP